MPNYEVKVSETVVHTIKIWDAPPDRDAITKIAYEYVMNNDTKGYEISRISQTSLGTGSIEIEMLNE